MIVKKIVSMITSLILAVSVSLSVMTADIVYANNNGVAYLNNSTTVSSDSTNDIFYEMLYSSNSDYRQWAQGDPRWGEMYLGSNQIENNKCKNQGCLVTCLTKMAIQAGLKDADSFNVATMINLLNNVGAFNDYGNLESFYSVTQCIPELKVGNNGEYVLSGGSYHPWDYNDKFINWVKEGYHILIDVGGHWILVDEALSISTGKVHIMNSLSGNQNADATLESQCLVFYNVFVFTGGTTPSAEPSSDIFISNCYIPPIITVGDDVPLTGVISSGYELNGLSIWVEDASNGYVTGGDRLLSSKSYDLSNEGYNFKGLQPGVYRVKIGASNKEKTKQLVNQSITVLANYDTGLQGTYTLRSAIDNSYVIGTGSDNNIELKKYENTADKTWYIEHLETGYYTIRNCASGLYFDVYSGGTASGTNIWQYDLNKSYAQQWQILPSGNTYYLVPRISLGCAADIYYAAMEDGTNITLCYTDCYTDSFMGANQRFVLDKSDCNFKTGNKITFDANGGTIPSVANTHIANGVNTGRGLGDLVVFNVPGITVNTNQYGIEAQVDSNGRVTKIRSFGSEEQLPIPEGGMVISGHQYSGNDGGNFVSSIVVGDYVGYDYDTKTVSVYKSSADYTANHKYLNNNDKYGDLPIPTREGYYFDGWYTAANGGTKITSSSTYISSTLYAHWATPNATVSGTYTYTGSPIIPTVVVTIGSVTLKNGTDYTVSATNNINAGTANYTVKAAGDYKFADITGTFTIAKAKASVKTAPTAIGGLKYDGTSKALVTAGIAANGTMVYSTDGVNYSSSIPTATAAGTYTVYYKAAGNENYTDSEVGKIAVTIGENPEIIKGISVSSQKLIVIYGYAGSTVSSRTVNVAFDDVTVEMIEWMYTNDTSCTLLADYVNAFVSKSSSDSFILTEAQLKAIEYVLNHDLGN
ncbi:MAG: RICIN domain-containing protein [Oscillospiraceae bacterium]